MRLDWTTEHLMIRTGATAPALIPDRKCGAPAYGSARRLALTTLLLLSGPWAVA